MEPANPTLCEHRSINSNTHSFIFTADSRDAIDVFAYHIEKVQLAKQWYNKKHLCLLLDARKAAELPIRYLFEIISDYNRPYPDLEPPRLTMAIIRSPETVVLDIYQVMAELFDPPLTIQFFTDAEKANQWLTDSN